MNGSGFRTALDGRKQIFDAIDAGVTQLLPVSISDYGLQQESVLDAIARLAGSKQGAQTRAYNARSAVELPSINANSIGELFSLSRQLNYTFNIEYIDAHVPEASALAIDLTALFGATVAIHAFVSGGGVPATPLHYDYTNAFTFHLCGVKRWQCYKYLELPTFQAGGFVVDPKLIGPLVLDRVLEPGETLFVPKGGLHLVSSIPNSNSVHLAVSVKNLGCYKFIAPFLDPEMDDPDWAGTNFEDHVAWLTSGINQFKERARGSEALKKARLTIWQLIYAQYNKKQCHPPPTANRPAWSGGLIRSHGRPLMVHRQEAAIFVELLDPSAGLVGNSPHGFQPSRVELPNEAEPFVQMLEAGEVNISAMRDIYDADAVNSLLQLDVDLELFHGPKTR